MGSAPKSASMSCRSTYPSLLVWACICIYIYIYIYPIKPCRAHQRLLTVWWRVHERWVLSQHLGKGLLDKRLHVPTGGSAVGPLGGWGPARTSLVCHESRFGQIVGETVAKRKFLTSLQGRYMQTVRMNHVQFQNDSAHAPMG